MPERILIADDDRAFRLATRTLLEDSGYTVAQAASGEEALTLLAGDPPDLLLSDMVMGEMSGLALLQQVRERRPGLPVIMVTGFGSIPTAVEAIRRGAADYLTKPVNNDELLLKVERVLEAGRKDRELAALREDVRRVFSIGGIVSRSGRMQEVIRLIRQVADTDVTVLIQGESGTGKELVARALHVHSARSGGPFVAVNCTALPEQLLESELFGHEKGAFTGALRQRAGRFEEAAGGTLFLDEIGDMSPSMQTRLLRVLQDKSFERVGGNATLRVDTRVVAATNRNLELMMRSGDFREDLYFRLNVFPIHLPPLRERMEDVPLLAEHFLERHGAMVGGRVKHIAPAVIHDMLAYHWRGNVRELENLVRRAMIKADGDTITAIETGGAEPSAVPPPAEPPPGLDTPYRDYMGAVVRDAEEKYLLRMLRSHKGNVNTVAKLMDVDRKTVYRKMAEYAIDPAAYRTA